MQEAVGATANSRFYLKLFAGAVARINGPVYFLSPVIPQIVYHSRRHIHRIPWDSPPTERPFYLIATEKQLAATRDQFADPLRVVATGEGRLVEMASARVVLVGVDHVPVSSPATEAVDGSRP